MAEKPSPHTTTQSLNKNNLKQEYHNVKYSRYMCSTQQLHYLHQTSQNSLTLNINNIRLPKIRGLTYDQNSYTTDIPKTQPKKQTKHSSLTITTTQLT